MSDTPNPVPTNKTRIDEVANKEHNYIVDTMYKIEKEHGKSFLDPEGAMLMERCVEEDYVIRCAQLNIDKNKKMLMMKYNWIEHTDKLLDPNTPLEDNCSPKKYEFLLKYKTNKSDDVKYKIFTNIEQATEWHTKIFYNYPSVKAQNRHIIHYELLVVPVDLPRGAQPEIKK